MSGVFASAEYAAWFAGLKQRIQQARQSAALALNSALLEMHWHLGSVIVERERQAQWGSGFIEALSRDLAREFPDMNGFSRRNLYAIRQWYLFYAELGPFVPQAVAQIPWGHNRLIVAKIKAREEALWYAQETLRHGWSRDVLETKIERMEYARHGKSISNFEQTLPPENSQLAQETLKDPYSFDFLGLEDEAQEKAIELGLTTQITQFLLELGKGFAYVGRQVPLAVGDSEYFLDMLFYHLDLRCFVVVELKAGKFKPEHAGKLNFYLSAVDAQMRRPGDNPSIGILLCKRRDRLDVEYSLKDINKPIGVSEYLLTQAIPLDMVSKLPTVAELEEHLGREGQDALPH